MADKWKGNNKNQDNILKGEYKKYNDYYNKYK